MGASAKTQYFATLDLFTRSSTALYSRFRPGLIETDNTKMNDTTMLDWLERNDARIDRLSNGKVAVRWWFRDSKLESEGIDLRDAIRGAYVGEYRKRSSGSGRLYIP